MQRATVMAALDLFFRCLGLFKGNLGSQAGVGVESRSEFLAAVEICLRQLDGREFFRFDAFREFAYREIENLFARHSGCSSGILRRSYGNWFRRLRRGLPFPFHQRLEVQPRSISIVRGKRAQPIERWLCFGS